MRPTKFTRRELARESVRTEFSRRGPPDDVLPACRRVVEPGFTPLNYTDAVRRYKYVLSNGERWGGMVSAREFAEIVLEVYEDPGKSELDILRERALELEQERDALRAELAFQTGEEVA